MRLADGPREADHDGVQEFTPPFREGLGWAGQHASPLVPLHHADAAHIGLATMTDEQAPARFTFDTHPAPLAEAERLADALGEHITLEPLAISISEVDEAKALWAVCAYFASEDDATACIRAGFAGIVAPVPDVDWVRRSLEGLPPVAAGRFHLIGSHDRHRRSASGIAMEIDAGTAFGTGHHGTTAGCLLAFDQLLKSRRPRRVFDLGCGTGVLAIAAARALRRPVLATDIDPEAVRVTRANARRNGAGPLVAAHTAAGLHDATIRANAPYDLIFANILARPLVLLAQGLANSLAPGGDLIVSGLTADQARWVQAAYRNRGLVPVRTLALGNWRVLHVRKPAHASCQRKRKTPPGMPSGVQSVSRAPGWEHA